MFCFAQTFERNLYFGLRGDSDVLKLQEFLTAESVYAGPITGNFFSLTLQAVRQYQAREGIVPAAGYFGPLTRTRANLVLSGQLQASENQAIAETGATTTPPIPQKTLSYVASTTQQQLDALLRQVALLQQQLSAQAQIQQTLLQIQQNTQTIRQNTNPPPVSPQPLIQEVKKELTVRVDNCRANQNGVYCSVYVDYLENGTGVPGMLVTITADDQGTFNSEGKENTNVQLTHSMNFINGKKVLAWFQYMPAATSTRTLTATANGLLATTTSAGQVDKASMTWNESLQRWE